MRIQWKNSGTAAGRCDLRSGDHEGCKEKSDKDPIFNNVGIEQRNERIAALADGKNIFYLDMNEVVCDEEGNLKSSLTFDDIHLYGSKYGIWVDYLKENGI